MTESPNNQRRRPSQARGLRARNRPRSGDNQNHQNNGQQSRPPQANRHRKNDNTKNGTKPGQRRKPNRPRTPHNKLDSELDFRLSRPSSLQQQAHNHHEEGVLFSQTQINGNGKGRGRPVRNGQQWAPSDGGIYLHELRGSDWYREDQARYAAKQIALENAERRQADGERTHNGESSQTRRPANKPRNSNRTQKPRQNTTTRRAAEPDSSVKPAVPDTSNTIAPDNKTTVAPDTTAAPANKTTTPATSKTRAPASVHEEKKPAESANADTAPRKVATTTAKPKPARKTATTGTAKKVTRKRKPVEKKESDPE